MKTLVLLIALFINTSALADGFSAEENILNQANEEVSEESFFQAAVPNSRKWACTVRRERHGEEVSAFGSTRRDAKRKAFKRCNPELFNCFLLDCDRSE